MFFGVIEQKYPELLKSVCKPYQEVESVAYIMGSDERSFILI